MSFFYSLFLFVLLTNCSFSQIFPDYKERSFLGFTDSLQSVNSDLYASDGFLNPDEYILGPGDKLFVSISGQQEIINQVIVNQEGYAYIPKVGALYVRDNTLTEAKDKIKSRILKVFRDVEIFISLNDFKKIKVSLVGFVRNPSNFVVLSNSRLIDLISTSKNLFDDSDIRNIKIQSQNGTSKTYDLLSFLRFGNKNNNPLLKEGDVVLIDKSEKVVSISGEVKYPGGYEFVEGEKAEQLLKLGGGFLQTAKNDSIEIVSFDKYGISQVSNYYTYDELKNIVLKDKDQIIVRRIPDYLIEKYAYISGFVKYPGYYKIIEDKTTLKDIVFQSGGFLPTASLDDASLLRTFGVELKDPEFERLKLIPRNDMTDDEYDYVKAKSRHHIGEVIVDFSKLFNSNVETENITLKRGDVINIPEKKDFVIILGQVVNPGQILYDRNLDYEDYIKLAGGYGWKAVKNDVRIIKSKTGKWLDANDVKALEPGDTIWIPEETPGPSFWEIFTSSLSVVGQLASVVAAVVAVIIATR